MERRTLRDRFREQPDAFVLPFAAAILIALWAVGAGKELWFDERFVQVISGRLISDMLTLLRFENNPPLTFALTNIWQQVVGSSEVALRTLSLLPSLGFLVALQRLARVLIERRGAALALLLAAVAGSVVTQAIELRMYPWLMLWATLALLFTWQYGENRRTRTLLALSLVHLLGLYTHYTYIFVFGFTLGWLLWRMQNQRVRILVIFGLAATFFAPWFFASVLSKVQDLQTNIGLQRLAGERWEVFLLPLRFIVPPWFLEGTAWTILRLLVSCFIVFGMLVALLSAVIRLAKRRSEHVFLGMFFITNVVALAIFGFVAPKYASSLIGAVVILVASGLVSFPASRMVRAIMSALLIGITAGASLRLAALPYVTYGTASAVVAKEELPADRVLVYPFNDAIAVRPYYGGALTVQGFFPLKQPEDVSLEDVVRYNFRVTLDSVNVERLRSYVGDARRVWFFFDVPPTKGYWNADLIMKWFEENGYRATMYRDIFRNVPPLLIRFDRVTLRT